MGNCLGIFYQALGIGTPGTPGVGNPGLLGNRHITVGRMELTVVKTIGEGGFSYVKHCRDKVDRDIALKQTLINADEERAVRGVIAECEFLRDLPRHPNVIGYCAHAVRPTQSKGGMRRKEILLACEYCPGTLMQEMNGHVKASTHFPTGRALGIFADVLSAVAHLHAQSPPVAHRDLKVENVLLGQDGRWKLCDLGSATTACYECRTSQHIAMLEAEIEQSTTLAYRAPEQCDLWSKKRVDEGVDVWALGVVLFYLCFLELPFEEEALAIINGNYTVPSPGAERVGAGVVSLIRALLTLDPAARPDAWRASELLAAALPAHAPIPRPRDAARQRNCYEAGGRCWRRQPGRRRQPPAAAAPARAGGARAAAERAGVPVHPPRSGAAVAR